MKTKLFSLLALLLSISQACVSQKTVTVTVDNDDISNNLDLYAIAYTFGEATDLADFETRLNDYDAQISNLDLNNDGEVDYLRVVEAIDNNVHLIVIQAVLAEDIYQDVATLTVEKEPATRTATVQIIGDPYIYGTNYVIEPVYVSTPVIYNYFWRPTYHRYYSPYYWGYYPNYFRYRRHVHINVYHHHMYDFHRLHHSHCQYHYADRPSHYYNELHGTVSKNDYGRRYPEKAFNTRNAGVTNKRDLEPQKNSRNTNSVARTPITRSSSSATATTESANSRRSSATNASKNNSRTTTQTPAKTNSRATTSSRNSNSAVRSSSNSSSSKQPARSSSSSSVSRSSKPTSNSSATRSSSSNTSGKSSVSSSSSSRSSSESRSSSSSGSSSGRSSSSSRSSSSNNNSRR